MQKLHTAREAKSFVDRNRLAGRSIGLVPTMGALHQGHLSLVRRCAAECDVSVATIFVNPTQFAENEDLDQYPKTLQADCEALQQAGVDAVFLPDNEEMFPAGHSTFVQPPEVARRWEGEFRPTHFRGVATIVLKLFHALPTTHAFFGRKDYQQLQVICAMVRDLNIDIEIVDCETVRENDGLALSSRNRYLSSDERQRALLIHRSLKNVADSVEKGLTDVESLQDQMRKTLLGSKVPGSRLSGVDKIDYAVVVDPGTLAPVAKVDRPAVAMIACRVGRTRLIDNQLITP